MSSIQISCSSLPHDIILKIGSSLQVIDLCTLSSCSRFWRELCASDILWEPLFKERWPLLVPFDGDNTQFPQAQTAETDENSQEWRRIYMMQHEEMGSRASEVSKFVMEGPATLSLEAFEYQHAIETMSSMRLGFQDVELFLLKPNLSVLLNLIGVLYCIQHPKPVREQILDALRRSGISEQVVWVKWLTLGRWSSGRRMRDETVSRKVCLVDVVNGKEETVLRVLQRGVVHEVLRVCISTSDLAYAPCTSSTIRNY
uniref:F-box domain-containing protein n=1 Tax=Noccaea caerulescens TaxID=107243 RepID=A0A1J3J1X3_NOCCA